MKNRTKGQASTSLDAEERIWRQLSQGLQNLARKPAVDFIPQVIEAAESDLRPASATAH